jgi:hypothetical protein
MSAHPTAAELRARWNNAESAWQLDAILFDAIAALEAAERERDEARRERDAALQAEREVIARLDALRQATAFLPRPVTPGPWCLDDREIIGADGEVIAEAFTVLARFPGSVASDDVEQSEAIAVLPDLWDAIDAATGVGDE